jgi:hypothetical protein
MPGAGRRLAVLGGILIAGNAGILVLAGLIGGPSEIGRRIVLLCSL